LEVVMATEHAFIVSNRLMEVFERGFKAISVISAVFIGFFK
jgi:hypothetical protein